MEDTNAPSTPGNAANFTDNETKLICAIMQNLTSEIQVSESKTPPSKREKTNPSSAILSSCPPAWIPPHHIASRSE
jgi:hypothetical protein